MPYAVTQQTVDYQKELDGDEEYWLQNQSAINEDVSNTSQINMKDGSVIEYVEKEDAIKLDDLTERKSLHASTKQGFNMDESALFSNADLGKSSNLGVSQGGGQNYDRTGSEV